MTAENHLHVSDKNAGAIWSAMAAYKLEADPRYAELERKLGVNAAKSIAITSAGNFWNADLAFSPDRIRDANVSLDDSRATAARLSVYNAVDNIARPRGIGSDLIGHIADSFYAGLSNFQRASLGNNPAAIPNQADMSAAIVKEVNAATQKTDPGGRLLDEGAKAVSIGFAAMRMTDMAQESSRNGSRYDQLGASSANASGAAYYSTPAGIAEMRNLAISSGVPWVANNPDLLRLGPQVIKDIAQTGITQKNFQNLRDAGMTTKKAATFVGAVNDMKLPSKDDNQNITDSYAKVYKNASPADRAQLDSSVQNYRDTFKKHNGDSDNPDVRQALGKVERTAHDSAAKTPTKDDDADADKITDILVKAGKIDRKVAADVTVKSDQNAVKTEQNAVKTDAVENKAEANDEKRAAMAALFAKRKTALEQPGEVAQNEQSRNAENTAVADKKAADLKADKSSAKSSASETKTAVADPVKAKSDQAVIKSAATNTKPKITGPVPS